jgi:hypothetical protein
MSTRGSVRFAFPQRVGAETDRNPSGTGAAGVSFVESTFAIGHGQTPGDERPDGRC